MRLPSTLFLSILFATSISCTQKKSESTSDSMPTNHHPRATANNYADSVNNGIISKDTLKGSPIRMAMDYIGDNHVHIVYGSPGVKGRIIWGGLVALDQVWVTGAHKATSIEFSKDVLVGEQIISAGKYAFFTVPGKEEWVLILNKNWDQHLADNYSEKEDVVRIIVKPIWLDKVTQRLTYSITKQDEQTGSIVVLWEKVQVALPFKNAN
ncbi:MAG: DUF2911 domain-containing protein [Cyclobacteriaceae bacterium]|nr:DUF2911 domain-containing protein [Cyclobacteriaceae bacterium]